jgi:pseudouridine kinase
MREDGYVLVIGAAGLDIKGRSRSTLQFATSNPGRIQNSFGGVGRNIAENLARLEVETVLLTAVGDDTSGDLLMAHCAVAGVDVTHVLQVSGGRSGSYVAVLDDDGDLSVAVSDYEIMQHLDGEFFEEHRQLFEAARLIVVDLNLCTEAIAKIIDLADHFQVPICVDPTSPTHAAKICDILDRFYLMMPNASETMTLCGLSTPASDLDTAITAAKQLVSFGIEIAIVTLGEKGVAYADHGNSGHIESRKTKIVDTTGAGDALTAAVIFGLMNGCSIDEAMRLGVTAASLTIQSRESVVPDLTPDLLYEHLIV